MNYLIYFPNDYGRDRVHGEVLVLSDEEMKEATEKLTKGEWLILHDRVVQGYFFAITKEEGM